MRRVCRLTIPVCLAILAAGCMAAEKSENPLGPSVAGPIPGVNITVPTPLEPRDGQNISVETQPITLLLENAVTTGQRPLNYLFEVATDTGFTNKVFTRESIAPGDGGRTSLRLPEPLGTGRTYYWRARAEDGANTGPYSGVAHFNVFTPIVIEKPRLEEPNHNETIDSLVPEFKIVNAPRSGPVGAISYVIEVSESDTFAVKVGVWTVSEQANRTEFNAPAGLAPNKLYFWHARAYDPVTYGPWSDIRAFRTPVILAPEPPGGGGGDAPCDSKQPIDILNCHRNKYGTHMSAGEVVSFLKASAKDINAAGTAGGPYGLLVKTSGSQCNGFSCDILCIGNGSSQIQRDVLLDSDGDQLPIWGGPKSGSQIAARQCQLF